jgi:hypothetical protein
MIAEQAQQKMNALEGAAQNNPNVAAADDQFQSAAQNADQVAANMQNASNQDSQAVLASLGNPGSGPLTAQSPSGRAEASALDGSSGNNAPVSNGADLAASANANARAGSPDSGAAGSAQTPVGNNAAAGTTDPRASTTQVAALGAGSSAEPPGDSGTPAKTPWAVSLGSPSDAKGRAPIRRADCPLDDIVQGIEGAMPSYCVLNVGKTTYIGEWHYLTD